MSAFPFAVMKLQAIGIIAIPVMDKKPQVKGFNNWGGLSAKSASKFAKQFDSSDIAILTKLSKKLVIDIDSKDLSILNLVKSKIGETPLIISTKNGFHLYYENPQELVGGIRRGSHPIDVKGAGKSDYVVCPPTNGYRLESEGSESFIGLLQQSLPSPNIDGFFELFPKHRQAPKASIAPKSTAIISTPSRTALNDRTVEFSINMPNTLQSGTRNSGLFKIALFEATKISQHYGLEEDNALLLEKRLIEINQTTCVPPLKGSEVKSIAINAWANYEMKGRNYYRLSHEMKAQPIRLSIEGLMESLNDPYGFSLLSWLVSHYSVDERFPLCRDGLSKILMWTEYRGRKAIDHLRKEEFVIQVSGKRNGYAARYILTSKAFVCIQVVPQEEAKNDNINSSKEAKRREAMYFSDDNHPTKPSVEEVKT